MSMNLHCEEVELWQTPTWVTYIIDSKGDGGWKGILRRYKIWVESHTQGVWSNRKELDSMRELVSHHIKELDRAAKSNRKLSFYIM